MRNAGARMVVGVLAAARVAIGVAFVAAPGRLRGGSAATETDTLMTRSFAVREVALGVGEVLGETLFLALVQEAKLLAVAGAQRRPSDVRLWAGLGALTDGGDLCAALLSLRREPSSSRVPVAAAAAGFVSELWAFRAATLDQRPRSAEPSGR